MSWGLGGGLLLYLFPFHVSVVALSLQMSASILIIVLCACPQFWDDIPDPPHGYSSYSVKPQSLLIHLLLETSHAPFFPGRAKRRTRYASSDVATCLGKSHIRG